VAFATSTADASARRARVVGPFKYHLVWPAVFIMLMVGLFPFVYSVVVSFQGLTMLNREGDFIGFANYARLFSDARLWWSVLHTAVITAVALPLELVFGLLMAQHFLQDHPWKKLFIALLIIPSVMSPVVAGSMWRLMFDDRYGPINQIIEFFVGQHITILWTIRPEWVYPAIIICDVWQWTPFMFVILLAALANVDRDQLDAAAIDGATRWKAFLNVTLPAIWPVMIIALIIRALDLVRLFDIVWQLTKGGPGTFTETISIYMFIRGFNEFETGYTGALVVVLMVLLSAIVVAALKRVQIAR
jgi:multiple sugar transport system permease protein